ncbi:Ca2+-transporting ATPase [Thermodesulfovibrio aggregans]|uniref:Ca2+-transporting ATPase n=1 Tax=Thermodesulfovibrio aggregans TaxID=86166 RepID=A0A0U9HLC3_9BACT|nr:cation-transporting P-type ATPase [Thermodesulfovibrio aggregans]GAQ93918.1 Ca2+-transporting ATPase [Thermodesulfovibrio aggregans]
MHWYQINLKEIYQRLNTSERGLTSEEVKRRLEKYGANKLAEEKDINKLKIFLHQFASPLIYILIIAGAITLVLKEYIDSGVIFAVVILNAVIGYIQEYKAEQSVRALKKMLVPKAKVLRDGIEKEVNSEELVPGDIVLLYSGIRVPADIRLVHTVELKIDESILTGESLPVEKHHHTIKDENLTYGDQKNMAFMGTIVVSGRAKGIVVETGMNTVFGKIAKGIREAEAVKAPLQDKIQKFANLVGIFVVVASVLLFVMGLIIGEGIKEMFMTAVAAAVAAIPEGLPMVVTVTLAVGVIRMAKRNAIVRRLHAVETLGSTTVICTDKTGTLTKNEMTVKLIYDGKKIYEVEGSGYEPKGRILHNGLEVDLKKDYEALIETLRIGLLCNESNIYEEDGEFKLEGDPTEGALIVSALKAGLNKAEEEKRYELIETIPFESERGYMATLHKHRGEKLVFIKGAPEKIVDLCRKNFWGEELNKKEIHSIINRFAKEGMRVLAFAYVKVPKETEEISCKEIEQCYAAEGLVFTGLQAMIDPPRPEAIEAIKGCKKAGIRVVMITGDHAVTAKAIGNMLGIGDEKSEVLTGKDLEKMTDEELFEKVKRVNIFARVSPEHKLKIVKQLMAQGQIVAVTGDGVNDAPALKAAHIGIAMGKSGTDVAKEASDMVLTDDNFASIFNAVKEGRVVFDNIRKVVFFLIPTGLASILSIIGAVVTGLPIPYFPAQILWINLVTNGLQVISLAFEPGEKGVIERSPRPPEEGIMSRLMIERTIIVGFLISLGVAYTFMKALEQGESLETARTVAVTTMVFFQFFQAWNSRSEYESIFRINPFSNMFLFLSLIVATLAQIAFIYLPALQWVFRTKPISAEDWQNIILIALSVIVVVEIDKWLRRKRR